MTVSTAQTGASACLQAFSVLLQALHNAEPEIAVQVPRDSLEDEFGRLRVWAANIGALQKGHSSLDYRLRDAPLVHENVLKLLTELKENLHQMLLVVSGARLPYEKQQPSNEDQDSDSDESNCSSNGEALSEESRSDGDSNVPLSEMRQRLFGTIDILDNMYKLSRSIRAPALHTRLLKAASYKQVDKDTGVNIFDQFEVFDLAFTKDLYFEMRRKSHHNGEAIPELNESDLLFIKNQATSISRRRQQFMYWRSHRKKLGMTVKPELMVVPSTQVMGLSPLDTMTAVSPPLFIAQEVLDTATQHETQMSTNPTALTQTTATVYIPPISGSNDGKSVTSFATTARGLDGTRVELPKLPKNIKHGRDFECPYCFALCPAKYQHPRAWRTHLLHDLRPYICTYPKCPQTGELYGTREEWLNHERSYHQKFWQCPEHLSMQFSTSIELQNHLKTEAHKSCPRITIPELLAMGERITMDNRRSCHICLAHLGTAEELHRHLANHLERFAAFALPRDIETIDVDDRSSVASQDISGGAHARSEESDDLEPFREYTFDNFQVEVRSTLQIAISLRIYSQPEVDYLREDFFQAFGITQNHLDNLVDSLLEVQSMRPPPSLDLSLEECIPVLKSLYSILQRLSETSDRFNLETWPEMREQLDYHLKSFSSVFKIVPVFANLSKETSYPSAPVIDIEDTEQLIEVDHRIRELISSANTRLQPSEEFPLAEADLARTDSKDDGNRPGPFTLPIPEATKNAKQAFLDFMTASCSWKMLADGQEWYTRFLRLRIGRLWRDIFQSVVLNIQLRSIAPDEAELEVVYTLLLSVAKSVQNNLQTSMFDIWESNKHMFTLQSDDQVEILVSNRHGNIPRNDDQILAMKIFQLIFSMIGWVTMIYEPWYSAPKDAQLANSNNLIYLSIPDVKSPLSQFFSYFHASTTQSYHPWRPLSQFPKSSINLISDLNFQRLHSLGIRPVWVSSFQSHLSYDTVAKTLSLFQFPSYCRMACRELCITSRLEEETPSASLNTRNIHELFENPLVFAPGQSSEFFVEMLHTYRIIWSSKSRLRNYGFESGQELSQKRQIENQWFSPKIAGDSDPLLELLRSSDVDETDAFYKELRPQMKTSLLSVPQPRDFGFFAEKLQLLLHETEFLEAKPLQPEKAISGTDLPMGPLVGTDFPTKETDTTKEDQMTESSRNFVVEGMRTIRADNSITWSNDGGLSYISHERHKNIEVVLNEHYTTLNVYLATKKIQKSRPAQKILSFSTLKFQELSTDVFDEVLRREALISRLLREGNEDFGETTLYLPPSDYFHPKRNAIRKRLSTLPETRFCGLAADVFNELERRFPQFKTKGVNNSDTVTSAVGVSLPGDSGAPSEQPGHTLSLDIDLDALYSNSESDNDEQERQYQERLTSDLRKAGLNERQIAAILNKDKEDFAAASRNSGQVETPDATALESQRPTSTRFARRYLSVETLNAFRIEYTLDKDPNYVIIKRWVPEYEQDFLWEHTKEIRKKRKSAVNGSQLSSRTGQAKGDHTDDDERTPRPFQVSPLPPATEGQDSSGSFSDMVDESQELSHTTFGRQSASARKHKQARSSGLFSGVARAVSGLFGGGSKQSNAEQYQAAPSSTSRFSEPFYLPKPTDDRIIEQQFQALMQKRGWENMADQAVQQMMNYSTDKKWTLIHEDRLADFQGEQRRANLTSPLPNQGNLSRERVSYTDTEGTRASPSVTSNSSQALAADFSRTPSLTASGALSRLSARSPRPSSSKHEPTDYSQFLVSASSRRSKVEDTGSILSQESRFRASIIADRGVLVHSAPLGEEANASHERDHIRHERFAVSSSKSDVDQSTTANSVELSTQLGGAGLGSSTSGTKSAAPQSQEPASRSSNVGGLRLPASKPALTPDY